MRYLKSVLYTGHYRIIISCFYAVARDEPGNKTEFVFNQKNE